MAVRLAALGTGNAACSAGRDNTYLALESESGILLIDCAGSPAHKLAAVGWDPGRVDGLLITHAHPDHLYGFPALIQYLAETGRERLFHVYGLAESLEGARGLLAAFRLSPAFVAFHTLPDAEQHRSIEAPDYWILTSPVKHSIPVLAARIEPRGGGLSAVYSSDTEPCGALIRLAAGADLFIHECGADAPSAGHSTPEQAGQDAAQAGAPRVVLIHCPSWMYDRPDGIVARVRKHFPGQVGMAAEGEVYALFEG